MDPFQDGRNRKVAVVLYYDACSGHVPAPISIALPALRATGININNGVRRRGRGSGAGGHRTMSPDTHEEPCLRCRGLSS